MPSNAPVTVLLSFGSNVGDGIQIISKAAEVLAETRVMWKSSLSSFYKTEPYGNPEQNWFINASLLGISQYSPPNLIYLCKSLEYLLGRRYRGKWNERELDIDILIYGSHNVRLKNLAIPHPEMHKRRFVLIPSAEIAPDLIHPLLNKSIAELLTDCSDDLNVEPIG